MKKPLINEAFRLQQLAGIDPINSLNEEFGYDDFMDAVDDYYEIGTPEHEKLSAAVASALDKGDIYPMPHEPSSYARQVKLIAKEIGLDESLNEEDNTSHEKIVYEDEENRLILDKDVDGTFYLANDFHGEDWDVWTEYEIEPSEEQVKLDVEDYLAQR